MKTIIRFFKALWRTLLFLFKSKKQQVKETKRLHKVAAKAKAPITKEEAYFKKLEQKRKAIYETNMLRRGLKKFYNEAGNYVFALNQKNADRKFLKLTT